VSSAIQKTTPGDGRATPTSLDATRPSPTVPAAGTLGVPDDSSVRAAVERYYSTGAQALMTNDLSAYLALVVSECNCSRNFRQVVADHRRKKQHVQGGDVKIQSVRASSSVGATATFLQEPAVLLDATGTPVGRDPGAPRATDLIAFVVRPEGLLVANVQQLSKGAR